MRILLSILLLISFQVSSHAQTLGCTDPLANNYNPEATENNGSCLYDVSIVTPIESFELNPIINETSGLILWEDKLWTHNDDTDINIYALDTLNGQIIDNVYLESTQNIDWEEITQNDTYIFMGDFGNNVSGNRQDLTIYRIHKQSILDQNLQIDTILFSYEDQTDFSPTEANATDFDCEAFIATEDSLYLFTKEWMSLSTTIYALSIQAGVQTAIKKDTWEVNGLITGATYLPEEQLIVLCGYNDFLQPFLYLLYDFKNHNFFSGNKRRIGINLGFHQVEGIATSNGLKYYISNELFENALVSNEQKLHILNLDEYLNYYLHGTIDIHEEVFDKIYSLAPNPAKNQLIISNIQNEKIYITDSLGRKIKFGLEKETNRAIIDISNLHSGTYILCIDNEKKTVCKKFIKE